VLSTVSFCIVYFCAWFGAPGAVYFPYFHIPFFAWQDHQLGAVIGILAVANFFSILLSCGCKSRIYLLPGALFSAFAG